MAKGGKAAQEFVPLKDIRDGVLVLKNGSLRLVMMVSSLNFALKSIDEQTGILLQFQNFLNSLDFSCQIFIQSRELDIRPYLQILSERTDEQENELIRIQIREYVEFIKNFTSSISIMTKNFFVVIPYEISQVQVKGTGVIGRFTKKETSSPTAEERFEESKLQLEQRALIVEQGLASTGVRTARLGTEELIELFYKNFNPGEIHKPPMPQTQITQT